MTRYIENFQNKSSNANDSIFSRLLVLVELEYYFVITAAIKGEKIAELENVQGSYISKRVNKSSELLGLPQSTWIFLYEVEKRDT